MFPKRAKEILNILITKDTPITGSKLAEGLGVSNRTIRSDIASINTQLSSEGVEVKSVNPYGYFIEENDKTLLRMILEEQVDNDELDYIPDTPNERMIYIMLYLLLKDEYCSMNDIADQIYVSKPTINADVRKLIQTIKEMGNHLQLQSSSLGIRLTGEELELRLFATRLLRKQEQGIDLMLKCLHLFYGEGAQRKDLVLQLYQSLIHDLEHHFYLSDQELDALVLYLMISVMRLVNAHPLKSEQISGTVDPLAMKLAQSVVDLFKVGMNRSEVNAIQEQLAGRRIAKAMDVDFNNIQIHEVIDRFLCKVKDIYGLDFSDQESLKRFLYLHIKPMLHRLRNKESEENPLKDEIKKKFPLATEISFLLRSEIKETFDLQMNDSEIAYIALHIAAALEVQYTPAKVVLVSDLGASPLQLMQSKLTNHFANKINVINAYTVYEFQNLYQAKKLPECDLVISTSHLKADLSVPMIKISPLVMREDISSVKHYIHYYATEIKDKDKFLELFHPELFVILKQKMSYEQVIQRLVHLAKQSGYIDDEKRYYQLVIQREEAYSTIMANHIAIPHAAENIANKTAFAVAILPHAVEHLGKKVSLVLLNLINEQEDLQTIYAAIEKMLEITSIEHLVHVPSYEEFIERL